MTVVDFIDVIDDIIDLSSDEETVQQEHIATHPRTTLVDRKAVFVLADEGGQDAQAAFVSTGEGSQEATESGNALVATASPSVKERAPLDASESKNCPSSPTTAPLPSLTSTSLMALTSEVGDTHLVAAASPSVMEKAPLGTAESKNFPSSPASVPLPNPTSATLKVLASEVVDAQLVTTASPLVLEKVPLGTAESNNFPSSPASAPLPSPTSATSKVMASEVGDAQLVTTASPLVMEKAPLGTTESKNSPSSPASAPLPSPTSATLKVLASEVGDAQPVTTASPSVMEKALLGTAESKNSPSSPASAPLPSLTSATPKILASEVGDAQLVTTASPSVMEKAPLDTDESKNCPVNPASAPLPSPTSTTPKALTSEVGDKKLVRVKHPKKSYHTDTPRRSPRLRECYNNQVEELAGDHKRSRMLEPAEESAAPTDNAESTKTLSTDSTN